VQDSWGFAMSDQIIVNSVEIETSGLRELFLGSDVEARIKEECDKKAKELSSKVVLHRDTQKGKLFVSKTKRLNNCVIGVVAPKNSRNKGVSQNIGLAYHAKHGIIGW